MQQDSPSDALSVLEDEAKSHPENVEANYKLAEAYAEQKRCSAAIEQYQIAIRLDPASSDLQNSLALPTNKSVS
jgi:cytochrome c-type biogenesis protein CcmH/NrfG